MSKMRERRAFRCCRGPGGVVGISPCPIALLQYLGAVQGTPAEAALQPRAIQKSFSDWPGLESWES